jgi:hypothetical protein
MFARQGHDNPPPFTDLKLGSVVSDTVAAPIFTATTTDGGQNYGLFDLMAAATRGELIDLPGMAVHQRALVVTVLAIMMHVLARYAKVDRISEISWAQAWDNLIGRDALRVTASHGEVAFLQPPTNEPTSLQSIEAADLLLPNVEHEVKRRWATTRAEQAIFFPHRQFVTTERQRSSQFDPHWPLRSSAECRWDRWVRDM